MSSVKGDFIDPQTGLRYPGHYSWWRWPLHIFRNRCPYCKCYDMWHHGSGEWTTLDNGKRVRLGAIECRACHQRWDWDDDDR